MTGLALLIDSPSRTPARVFGLTRASCFQARPPPVLRGAHDRFQIGFVRTGLVCRFLKRFAGKSTWSVRSELALDRLQDRESLAHTSGLGKAIRRRTLRLPTTVDTRFQLESAALSLRNTWNCRILGAES